MRSMMSSKTIRTNPENFLISFLGTLFVILFLFPGLSSSRCLLRKQSVKAWEEDIKIPTYLTGKPDPFPIFYNGRAYQGAQGRVYPYPLHDKLTETKKTKTYRALYLENKYLRLCVLPELGGKLFSILDKTNNYDLIYRQSVIKPALIGMLGAWTSGGIEWDFPHHHRPTSFMAVDHTITENPDGSKTIWIGELELMHRMKWVIGLSLYPNRSYIEASVHLINRTPLAHSFLYWANVAVHANKDYQVIFPSDTQFATYHGKNQFTHWPISREFYHRVDYSRGVDISWWKNHPAPTSFFAWKSKGDFLAGYDHGKQAGLIHWADHHSVPGKKLWNWGTGEKGRMWEKMLTDKDGPYIELMVGAFSDNQPDYSWIQPYERKIIQQFWYPLQKMGGVKAANTEAALNLEFAEKNEAKISLNLTRYREEVSIVFWSGEEKISTLKADIGPGNPYQHEIRLSNGISKNNLAVRVTTKQGQELISHSPIRTTSEHQPEPVKPPLPPEKIKTIEQLYLTGSRLEQFHNPRINAFSYYQEALDRDLYDSRTNTALGILHIKAARYQKAQECLNRALERVTHNHTHPRNAKAYYYLGFALRKLGNLSQAKESFAKATWDHAWSSAGTYQLAEISCINGDYDKALKYLTGPLSSTEKSAKKLNLLTVLMRKTDHLKKAKQLALRSLQSNPLDFWAKNELYLTLCDQDRMRQAERISIELTHLMRGSVQSYLELALDYGNSGFNDEAIDVLRRYHKIENPHPLTHYYLGFFYQKNKQSSDSALHYQKASQLSSKYGFPFRTETIPVLLHALEKHPEDAKAAYYLGNCFFEHQPRKAIFFWEKSSQIDPADFMVHRNLGLAYVRIEKNIPQALRSMETAIELTQQHARLFLELDQIYELAKKSPEFRLSLLNKYHKTVKDSSDALIREISLLVQLGHYDRAIRLMNTHHFHVWEGGGQIHHHHVDAHLLRGYDHFVSGEYNKALSDYRAALKYPQNQEVGKPYQGGQEAKIHYFIGQAYAKIGKKAQAMSHFKKSLTQKVPDFSDLSFYQALCMDHLGLSKQSENKLDHLIQTAQDRLEKENFSEFFIKFGSLQSASDQKARLHFLLGLGYLGKGRTQKAQQEFQKTIELNLNHTWASWYSSHSAI
ncbi:MAG: DUF5107 domain-containing protein [Candidatus Aminicenantes bacterium]|nr:DUF5107 domain-containing protein [Candidatus Aminicenantes bacterium]